jgi:hypothetical protein
MPKRTIELLDQLSHLGFSDEDFRTIHHMPDASINRHVSYCRETGRFHSDDANEKVRKRLELVFALFKVGHFSAPAKPGVFRGLAEAASAEIPK